MPAPRFLALITGRMKQVAAIAASTGASDADKIPATNSNGVLDPTLINAATTGANKVLMTDGSGRIGNDVLPVGLGADTKSIVASEALGAGDFVNVYNNAGTLNVRKADGTGEGKEVIGFVLAAASSGASALVYFEGTNTQRTGLTVGARYYLGTTPGSIVTAPPSAAGNIVQYVGVALSATELSFEPSDAITVA